MAIKYKIEIKDFDLRGGSFVGRVMRANEYPQGKSSWMTMECIVSDSRENIVKSLSKKYPAAPINEDEYVIPWPNTLDE